MGHVLSDDGQHCLGQCVLQGAGVLQMFPGLLIVSPAYRARS
jgi:hypothetical protein